MTNKVKNKPETATTIYVSRDDALQELEDMSAATRWLEDKVGLLSNCFWSLPHEASSEITTEAQGLVVSMQCEIAKLYRLVKSTPVYSEKKRSAALKAAGIVDRMPYTK